MEIEVVSNVYMGMVMAVIVATQKEQYGKQAVVKFVGTQKDGIGMAIANIIVENIINAI